MGKTEKSQQSEQGEPSMPETLGKMVRNFIPDPDADAAAGRDTADDASGEEVPQDGDPGR